MFCRYVCPDVSKVFCYRVNLLMAAGEFKTCVNSLLLGRMMIMMMTTIMIINKILQLTIMIIMIIVLMIMVMTAYL